MTTRQAAQLRVNWKLQCNAYTCEHLNLEMESTNNGHLTGYHTCIVCGHRIANKPT
jgi:hypothetical protein